MPLAGVVIDLDGVLWVGGSPAPSAGAFLESLRHETVPYCILTNDCSICRVDRLRVLTAAKIQVDEEAFLTPPVISIKLMQELGIESIMYLGTESVRRELSEFFELRSEGNVDAVVVGDLFDSYNRLAVETAVRHVLSGAKLVALQRNRFWGDGHNRQRLDVGFWVAAFEQTTGQQAILAGKPSSRAYAHALRYLRAEASPDQILMLSDDALSDLAGARSAGLLTLHLAPPGVDSPPWVSARAESLEAARSMILNWK